MKNTITRTLKRQVLFTLCFRPYYLYLKISSNANIILLFNLQAFHPLYWIHNSYPWSCVMDPGFKDPVGKYIESFKKENILIIQFTQQVSEAKTRSISWIQHEWSALILIMLDSMIFFLFLLVVYLFFFYNCFLNFIFTYRYDNSFFYFTDHKYW